MVIRFPRFLFSALAVLAAAPLAAAAAIERGVAFVYGLLAPTFASTRDFRLAPEGPVLNMNRAPFDPALQHSLRHEAGHRRRAAMRGG